MVPLRPLGAGEIVDGAITTIRKNPMATIGLAAIVGAIMALVSLLASWVLASNPQAFVDSTNATTEQLADAMAVLAPVALVQGLVVLVATTILTGLLTVVVGQAVIGQHLTIGAAWSKARPRLLRLIGLTLVYTLIWLGAFLGVMIISMVIGIATDDVGGFALMALLGFVGGIVLGVWLYVRYALAVPSLMLESENSPQSGTRPVRIGRSLRRSATLVRGSWWRVFGILLMITIIGAIVTWAINIPFQTIAGVALTDPEAAIDLDFGSLVLTSLGQMLATAIAAPFVAAATVLLYIDRRIRREGLDLELARAAGVSLPGRDAPYQPPSSYGQPWTSQPWTSQPGQYPPPPGQPGGQYGQPGRPDDPPAGPPPR